MKEITINLNDEIRKVIVEPNDILLDVLRDKLGITSPKCGCDPRGLRRLRCSS